MGKREKTPASSGEMSSNPQDMWPEQQPPACPACPTVVVARTLTPDCARSSPSALSLGWVKGAAPIPQPRGAVLGSTALQEMPSQEFCTRVMALMSRDVGCVGAGWLGVLGVAHACPVWQHRGHCWGGINISCWRAAGGRQRSAEAAAPHLLGGEAGERSR